MTRVHKIVILAMLTTLLIFSLCIGTACNKVDIKLRFEVDGELYDTISTNGQEVVTIPTNPVKDGFVFEGWYWDNGIWEKPFTANSLLDAPISSDMSVYAQFTCAHFLTEWDKRVEASCEAEGLSERHCTRCEYFESQYIEALGHVLSGWSITKAATPVEDGIKERHCTRENCVYKESEIIPATNSSATIYSMVGGEVNGLSITAFVKKNVDSLSLSTLIKATDDTIWHLYKDSLGQQEIPTKICVLDNGYNTYYIVATSKDGYTINVYTLTIYRAFELTISYYDGATCINQEIVDSNEEFIVTYVPNIIGYTFNYWEHNGREFKSAVLFEDISLSANKTAKKYVVTLDVNGGNALDKIELDIAYDSVYALSVPEKIGYTFLGWYKEDTLYADACSVQNRVWHELSDIILTAKWQINRYNIIVNQNDNEAGCIAGGGSYTYGEEVVITATTNSGYTWLGWFDGETKVSEGDSMSYSFEMPAYNIQLIAKWDVQDIGMKNFKFTLTDSYGYKIIGVKDTSVTEIIVPDYVRIIERGAFSGCSNLESITLPFVGVNGDNCGDADRCLFGSVFGSVDYDGGVATNQYYNYKYYTYYVPKTLKEVVITSAYYISKNAFYNCNNLTSVTLPESITYIPEFAFDGCSHLTEIKLGNSVTRIARYAFYGCSWLREIILPNSVESIGEYAFGNCGQLMSATIGNGVESIETFAFKGCNQLNSMVLPFVGTSRDATSYESVFGAIFGYVNDASSVGGVTYQYDSGNKIYYYYIPSSLRVVTITGGEIPDSAFYNCVYLTNITIGEGITYIGEYAFYGCSNLTSITISDYITHIGNNAFPISNTYPQKNSLKYNEYDNGCYLGNDSNPYVVLVKPKSPDVRSCTINENCKLIYYSAFVRCYNLTGIIIPDSVTSIGYGSFFECSNLASVTIPNSITNIGRDAFSGCSSLTHIYYKGTVEDWSEIVGLDVSGLTSATIHYIEEM